MVKSYPLQPWLKGQIRILFFNRTKTAQVIASYGSLKENCSVLIPPPKKAKQSRELNSLTVTDHVWSFWIHPKIARHRLLKEKKKKETTVSNQKGKSLTGDWSFDDRRRRRTPRCKSCHFFPRSSFGRHWRAVKVLKLSEWRGKRKKKSQKFSEKEICSCSARSGFYRPISARNDASKRAQSRRFE